MLLNYIKQFFARSYHSLNGGRGELSNLQVDTAIIHKNMISTENTLRIRKQIDNILADSKHPRIKHDNLQSDSRVLCIEEDIPELVDLLDVPNCIKNIEDYLGKKVNSWFLMANRVQYVEGNKGSGGGWHRDSPFSKQIKFIWYLSDVNKQNGPFEYIEKTNTNDFKSRKKYPIGKTRFDKVYDTQITVTGKEGDLLICDTHCIHRGRPIEAGTRYAITLYTSPNVQAKEIHKSH